MCSPTAVQGKTRLVLLLVYIRKYVYTVHTQTIQCVYLYIIHIYPIDDKTMQCVNVGQTRYCGDVGPSHGAL